MSRTWFDEVKLISKEKALYRWIQSLFLILAGSFYSFIILFAKLTPFGFAIPDSVTIL